MSADPGYTPDRGPAVSLPADRSFVLQFRTSSGIDATGPWAGRVEHVVTGEATRFEDWAGLREFIARILRERTRSPDGAREGGVRTD
ncbi:hypothetical protein BN12_2370006 [Nostocoides japonicum T1-X7]|uniref:Uncharacterized protein n=1 Tax=Nostocoides japonicum T1-X7 TaxID=1194083 RepID=A0A077LW16_9MICO|nr:hypothetical protein [Tetrasphaera japonica]CCH77906.1 hypothetical protein BN12_2370006 [Tetrasphaera japonica T1-X7]